MNNELEMIWKGAVVVIFKLPTGICLEGLRIRIAGLGADI
jgi:hypothetical protein